MQSHKEGVILTNYDKVLSTGDIKLNNPADSKIYKVLNKTDPEERMPHPRPPRSVPNRKP